MVEITTVFRNQNYHHHSWTKPIFGSSRGEIHSWELGWTELIDKTSWEKKLVEQGTFSQKINRDFTQPLVEPFQEKRIKSNITHDSTMFA